jgi:transposase-like protein DUF772
VGRPSIAPERLLRALLLQVFYSARSERRLMEQLNYNLLLRWFVGLERDSCCGASSPRSKLGQSMGAKLCPLSTARVTGDFGLIFSAYSLRAEHPPRSLHSCDPKRNAAASVRFQLIFNNFAQYRSEAPGDSGDLG